MSVQGALSGPLAGPFGRQVLSLAAAGLVLALVPLLPVSNQLLQIFTIALMFAIPAIGLGLLYGEAGQMSVANGALFGIGAYVAAIGAREQVLTIWWALGAGALAAAVAAVLVGLNRLCVCAGTTSSSSRSPSPSCSASRWSTCAA